MRILIVMGISKMEDFFITVRKLGGNLKICRTCFIPLNHTQHASCN